MFAHAQSLERENPTQIQNKKVAITLKGRQVTNRVPVHLVFLIDISDSMSGEKLNSVKKSIEFLLPFLTQEDIVSLITFGEDSRILLKGIPTDAAGKNTILEIMKELQTKGCTNMSAGLLSTLELMSEEPVGIGYPGHKHGILLLTDGHANRGVSTPDELLEIITRLLSSHPSLTLTTVGYGVDHNAELLRRAAVLGTGSYNVVYTLENVATVFGEVFGGLTTVVAQNVTVSLPLGSSIETCYPTYSDKNKLKLDIKVGDIYAENEIIIFADLSGSSVGVKWCDMSDLSIKTQEIQVEPYSPDVPIPKQIIIAQHRQKVSKLLLKRPIDSTEIYSYLTKLRELPFAQDVIIQMMIDDLEHLLETVDTGIAQQDNTDFTQHAAYLSLGRGLRSVAPTPQPQDPVHLSSGSPRFQFGFGRSARGAVQDPIAPFPTVAPTVAPTVHRRRTTNINPTSSPFSNQQQSTTTSLIREVSGQRQQGQQRQQRSQSPP